MVAVTDTGMPVDFRSSLHKMVSWYYTTIIFFLLGSGADADNDWLVYSIFISQTYGEFFIVGCQNRQI